MNACCDTPVFEPPKAPTESSLRTVVLIGPPNSGKSTLFNKLTGLRQKVANYPGVTVELVRAGAARCARRGAALDQTQVPQLAL